MSEATATAPLLEPAFLRKLEQWSLAVRRSYVGQFGGERRSTRHGHSVEFADFRNYVPGDDVRFVDWNLYARLERLFLKLFLHEQEIYVHLLVDLSESMTYGRPPKALLARKIAAALGFLALAHQDGLAISVGAAGPASDRRFPGCRGRGYVNRMMAFLQHAPQGGELSLARFVRQALLGVRRSGLVVLITDFFDPEGHEGALRTLLGGRHEGIAIHVLDREEWEPSLRGDLKLIDSETQAAVEVSITPRVLHRYRQRARAWADGIEAFCTGRGVAYLRLIGEPTAEEAVLRGLCRLGRLK